MAQKRLYIGSVGPLLYDDASPITDPEFPGQNFDGFVTDGNIFVKEAPVADEHVVRKTDLLDLIWPVDSIYLAVNSTNPSTLFGGTWVRIAEGQFLVGQQGADPDFGVVEAIGGNKEHTHDVDPAVITSSGPSDLYTDVSTPITSNPSATTEVASGTGATVASSTHTHTAPHSHSMPHTHTVNVGNTVSEANSTLPPFFVAYVWKRTA